MNTSIIISLVCGWVVGAVIAYLISILFDSNYTKTIKEARAKVILWSLTMIIYLLIGVVLLIKYVFLFAIDIFKGFWQFIKSVPEIITDL